MAYVYYLCSSGNPEREIIEFVQERVIPYFHRQRQERDQFAVLIVNTSSSSIKRIKYKPSSWWPQSWGQPTTNSNTPTHPQEAQISNYVVARPDNGNHAERFLLNNLNTLMINARPHLILLYSWMMPCPRCTTAIERSLGNMVNVVVVYTVDWKEISYDENEGNRRRLREAGIRVIRAAYDTRLPQI